MGEAAHTARNQSSRWRHAVAARQQKRLSLANKESVVLSRTAQNVSNASVGVQYSQKKREQQRSECDQNLRPRRRGLTEFLDDTRHEPISQNSASARELRCSMWSSEPEGEAEKPEATAPWSEVKGFSANPVTILQKVR